MESLIINNATFFSDKIVLNKKKGQVVIERGAIDYIRYKKPTFINYLLASVWFGGTFPGRLEIYIKDNIYTKKVYKTKLFLVKIKYNDYIKLPYIYKNLVC